MKITEALQKAALKKDTISSESLKMEAQDLDSIGYWLVGDPASDDKKKIKVLKEILATTDWELDND